MTRRTELEELNLSLVLVHQAQQTLALESRWVLGCQTLQGQQLLTLKSSDAGSRYLHVSGDVEFIEVAATQLHPLPALMQARKTWPAVKALVEYQGQLLVLLDVLLLDEQALATG